MAVMDVASKIARHFCLPLHFRKKRDVPLMHILLTPPSPCPSAASQAWGSTTFCRHGLVSGRLLTPSWYRSNPSRGKSLSPKRRLTLTMPASPTAPARYCIIMCPFLGRQGVANLLLFKKVPSFCYPLRRLAERAHSLAPPAHTMAAPWPLLCPRAAHFPCLYAPLHCRNLANLMCHPGEPLLPPSRPSFVY